MTEPENDKDKTEVVPASGGDRTEHTPDPGGNSAGFTQARAMARNASREADRLLKERFVLEDVLGRGGMGAVYRARDLRKVEAQDSNPHIAVKVLAGDFKAHPQAFVTLQQEAVKSQTLAHPNIITVYDFDRDGDTVFITMELLKGDALDSLLRLEAPFSVETSLRYFRELSAGLEYAHKRGLIHSDFKPANVFVTAGGTVKILDFGIARAASQERAQGQFDAGTLGALTPAYATVEMVNREPPSFSDDVYALGCVLYEMLTGEHPYQRVSAPEALEQGLKPAKPAVLNAAQWQALSQGIELNKAKRFSSVEAFRAAMLPAKKSPVRLISAAATILLIFVAWMGYQQYRGEAEREAELASRLEAAKDCFYQQDYACARDNAIVVSNLQEGHMEAARILQASQENLEQEATESVIKSHLSAASECLAGGDLDCTGRALEQARNAGASDADTFPIEQGVNQVMASRALEAKALEERIADLLAQAEACFEQADYECSDQAAEAVLELDANNTSAIEIRQQATMAGQLRKANEETVANFLADAEICYQRKNFSCAIAKAESALAILPDFAAARRMRDQSRSAQQAAKKSISIE
ncbi:serine/threonine-protein kinase [Pseudohalioglobus lutimaris]|uniref:Serine/threonine protein kinase n=1 Tax=Pseudohalioglobus lutimaris TaxID=1737061 RepID=A0A2N5X7W9_9GAMM|nr:serine/threonine-protein kinase [Pseudohalioglobus lutimaris]PLW70587.1 serine/threonine protein kinase [Pseudohalioglobus lutimaris]